jgi:catechol 2,3-dioxygenase-like lactoylglutathione lyase family enzyme
MFADKSSSAIVAVKDLAKARAFYEDVLGLSPMGEASAEVVTFRTGGTHLVVYRSEFAGTNKANADVWGVGDDIERIVADLAAKGVSFEHYEMPGATYAAGLHRIGDFRMAWFKDPDGNVLHINSAP